MSLSDIVHRFKTLTTKQYTDGVKQNNRRPFNKKLRQRNFYEHIIVVSSIFLLGVALIRQLLTFRHECVVE